MELDIMTTIQQGAAIPVAVVCFLAGAWLKRVSFVPDELIPVLLGVIGVAGVLWFSGWAVTPENVVSGIFSAALAVYAHQSGKQLSAMVKDAVEGDWDD